MYQWLLKHKILIKRTAVYAFMTFAVVVVATFIIFFVLGFRFDTNNGRIEQYAFLQFGTSPSGATVSVDGVEIGDKTPNKTSVRAGQHQVTMTRDGYEPWQKTIDVKSGTINWLNYALLIPKKMTVESVLNYNTVNSSLASPEGRSMIVQQQSNAPVFDLADLSSDAVRSTKLTIPATIYSEAAKAGVEHVFKIAKWDDGGRYVLVKHNYSALEEWLVLDTQDAKLTKNITRIFNILIGSIVFSGTSGNEFYVLNKTDIRKLNLSAGTISKPLISNVTSFEIYKTNIITYIGVDISTVGGQVAGVYRDGDTVAHVLRTKPDKNAILHIATSHYFNSDYIVISDGKRVDILSGSYPNSISDNSTSMKIIATYAIKENVQYLSFSPIGEYVLTQTGANYTAYDIEYHNLSSSSITGAGAVAQLKWLDDSYLWSDKSGSLIINEFDGTNSHVIAPVTTGQDVTLTHNEKYIYSINKTGTGYQLQRVLMILP